MKKIIAFILTLIMLFAVMAPAASAVVGYEAVPIIYIRGNGEALYNEEGKEIAADLDGLFAEDESNDDVSLSKDAVVEACVNVLLPFLTEGMIFDKWDNYGRAIYDELSPLFKEAALDGDGNPQYGTAVSAERLAKSEYYATQDYKWGGYGLYEYGFIYDWRLSPYDHVDRLHKYIETVKATTGKRQVCIFVRCLGGSLATAYLEKYGSTGNIKNIYYGDVLSNGTALINDAFSGNIAFDAKAVQLIVKQLEHCAETGMGTGIAFVDLIDEIVTKTLDTFTQIGAADSMLDSVEDLYSKLYKALIPAVCFATGIATQVNYWTCVYEEDFDDALNLIFGEEGSEARTYYAGLIEKIEYYREHVTSKLPELYGTFSDDYKVNIGVGAKYGYMDLPIIESTYDMTDGLVGVADASFGATCADFGKTLSQEYIDARVKEGKGAYISPDKKIDTSTCLYPDTTWIFKNCHHDCNDANEAVALEFLSGTGVTIHNAQNKQFITVNEADGTWANMTEDNCQDFEWASTPVEEPTKETIAVSFIRWFTMIFNLIAGLLKGEIKFGSIGDIIKSMGV